MCHAERILERAAAGSGTVALDAEPPPLFRRSWLCAKNAQTKATCWSPRYDGRSAGHYFPRSDRRETRRIHLANSHDRWPYCFRFAPHGVPRSRRRQKPNVLDLPLPTTSAGREFGFQGGKDIPTPHIDSIAKNGVRFTQGYVSGPYCSPTRAGLMTAATRRASATSSTASRQQARPAAQRNDDGRPAQGRSATPPAPSASGTWATSPSIARRSAASTSSTARWPTRRSITRRSSSIRASRPKCKRSTTRTSTRPTPTPSGPSIGSASTRTSRWFLYLPFNAQHAPLQAPEEISRSLPEHRGREAPHVRGHDVGDGRRRRQGAGQAPRDAARKRTR